MRGLVVGLKVETVHEKKTGKTKFIVKRLGEDGKPDGRATEPRSFKTGTHFNEATKILGVEFDELNAVITEAKRSAANEPKQEADKPETKEPSVYTLRSLKGSDRETFDTFTKALEAGAGQEDAVIEWKDAANCVAVDFDWHGVDAPKIDIGLEVKGVKFSYAWVTKSGGLRLVYECPHADLIAACAVVELYRKFTPDPTGIELLTRTRCPKELPVKLYPLTLSEALGPKFQDEIDKELVEQWLEDRGMETGRRYDHSYCPIAPEHKSNSLDPVWVSEKGLFCHSCQSRGSGFRSFAALLGYKADSALSRMVRNFVHWDHAKFTLVTLYPGLSEEILRVFYRACLVNHHGTEEPRVDPVFDRLDLVRCNGFWSTSRGEMRKESQLKATVACLPAVKTAEGKVNAVKHERFLDNVSLDEFGYVALRPVHGFRVGTFYETPDGRPRLVIPHQDPGPQFLPDADRMSEEKAWGVVEVAYPGIDRQLIELLCFCRGLVERNAAAMPPVFLFDGVTGTGKTGHLHLAASFCGDHCTDIVPALSEERMGQKVYDALRKGTFAVVNEVMKGAAKNRIDPLAFLDFILHLSPKATTHVLYKGQLALDGVPVLAITDNSFTDAVMADAQLGRRILYRHLGSEPLTWKTSTVAYGVIPWDHPRGASDGGQLRRAVDSLLSHWIDRYFAPLGVTLDEVAADLGVGYLDTHGPAAERLRLMRELFKAWLAYPGPESEDAKRRQRSCPGFKAFKTDGESSQLSTIWSMLHDEGNPASWSRSSERSWASAVGHPKPLRIEVKPMRKDRGDWVMVRFQELRGDGQWINLASN